MVTKINSSRTGLNRRSAEIQARPLSGDASRGDERAIHLLGDTPAQTNGAEIANARLGRPGCQGGLFILTADCRYLTSAGATV
jgi:hypothetical protein